MDSCVCEKAVTTTQLAHRGVDLYKILGGKWKTCPPPQGSLDSLQATHMSNSQTLYISLLEMFSLQPAYFFLVSPNPNLQS